MPRFIIDENMPRSTGKILAEAGYPVMDVRDYALRGATDDEIYRFAQEQKAVILTADIGFGNILRFPVGSHWGILIAHFPGEISNRDRSSATERSSQQDRTDYTYMRKRNRYAVC